MLFSSDRNVLLDNTIANNGREGVDLRGANDDNVLRDNIVENNGDAGIRITDSSSVGEEPPSGTILKANNIESNAGHGLNVEAHDGPVDATDNWWGHDTGPSGGIIDACTGTTADGDGQSIAIDGTDVCFDTWLTEPNPDAGAQ